ncbi:MAG: ATP-binding protein [Armatimonadota bacterium]
MEFELALLRSTIEDLKNQIKSKDLAISALEQANKRLEERLRESEAHASGPTPLLELDETLKRLVTKISMILQAEKAVVMLYDKENNCLYASKPAVGLTDDELSILKLKSDLGVSGEVFSTRNPVIIYDAENDPRTDKNIVNAIGIKNGVCVPLVVEKRNFDTNQVSEIQTIGVMHVFNKKYGNVFIQEDVNLLTRLANNAASIIASAQIYRAVIQEKQELAHVLESVNTGLVMVNKDGKILQINPAGRRFLGIDENLKLNKDYRIIIDQPIVQDLIGKAIAGDADVRDEIILPDYMSTDENEKVYQIQSSPVRDDNQEKIGVLLIFNDITETRSIERMKTAFVSTVSHELRTPLTSIKGFIGTLLNDEEGFYDRDTTREFYNIIYQECERLTRLINDLLNVSRIEAGKALELNLTEINLEDIVRKVVSIQKSYADKHTFVIDFPDDIPPIYADADKVDQILTNLIHNAIKYSPDGCDINIQGSFKDGYVQIKISDNGIGIPKEQLERIFERFHRVDNRNTRKAGGTGLGLYLVKHLVAAHKGRVWAESEIGKGSTFFVELPIKAQLSEKTNQTDEYGYTESAVKKQAFQ